MTETIKLFSQGGSTSIHIDVRIKKEGDLLFSGQDIGDAPEEIFGDLDYEYWLTVPAEEPDREAGYWEWYPGGYDLKHLQTSWKPLSSGWGLSSQP